MLGGYAITRWLSIGILFWASTSLVASAAERISPPSGLYEAQSFSSGDQRVVPTYFQEAEPKPQPPAAKPSAQPKAQPAPALPPPQANPFLNNQQPRFMPNNQRYLARMSRAPDMFGDSRVPLTARIQNANRNEFDVNLPFGGGSHRFKNEHGQALPTDRVFGLYHHFENAINVTPLEPGTSSASRDLDRFTLGFEKTFLDGNASVELRLPMSSTVGVSTPDIVYRSETVGDLVVTLKGLLYADDEQAWSMGLAVVTPTGRDVTVVSPTSGASGASLKLENDAAHFVPFIAFQATPTDDFFIHSYLQLDTPTNPYSAQSVVTTGPTSPSSVRNFRVTDQTLLYADIALGHWWFRDAEAQFLSGLASLLELHYTTALTSPDQVSLKDNFVSFGSQSSGNDVVNLTIGLHAEFARSTSLRVGYVTPLRNDNHRYFDNEITVALVYRR